MLDFAISWKHWPMFIVYPQNLHKNNLVHLLFQSYLLEKGHLFQNSKKIIIKEQIESILWAKIEIILNFTLFKIIASSKTTLKLYGERVFPMIYQYLRNIKKNTQKIGPKVNVTN